jgi:hypothetical protein
MKLLAIGPRDYEYTLALHLLTDTRLQEKQFGLGSNILFFFYSLGYIQEMRRPVVIEIIIFLFLILNDI